MPYRLKSSLIKLLYLIPLINAQTDTKLNERCVGCTLSFLFQQILGTVMH